MSKTIYVLLSLVLLASPMTAYAQSESQTEEEGGTFNTQIVTDLPQEDQDSILNILRATKLLGQDEDLSVLEGMSLGGSRLDPIEPQNIWKEICKAGCDAAAAVAAAACIKLSGPAIPVCLAATEAGRNYCRSRC